ncbi:hypothetical protein EZS27_007048 [termite gut metagenome]|uniref:Uncharacterized protein n=1 Tax=termite gut metagenome TaxID=433724 RepID=A0A5J4SGV2_9ZZZZ
MKHFKTKVQKLSQTGIPFAGISFVNNALITKNVSVRLFSL